MNVGTTIREARLNKRFSQGDVERRTGLLRCYLSRVENGHTQPTLTTLEKIAGALEVAISELLDGTSDQARHHPMSETELQFLRSMRRYAANLSEGDKKLLVAMVRKFGETSNSAPYTPMA